MTTEIKEKKEISTKDLPIWVTKREGLFNIAKGWSKEKQEQFLNVASMQFMNIKFEKQYEASFKMQYFTHLCKLVEVDLLPSLTKQYVYFIPYKDKLELQIGVNGYIEIANRAGLQVTSQVVYSNDRFSIDFAENKVEHNMGDFDRGKMIGVYCTIKNAIGTTLLIETMSKSEIDDVKGVSKAPNSPAWSKFYNEMARKVVIKRALKRPIADIENNTLAKAIEIDNQNYELEQKVQKKNIDLRGATFIKKDIAEDVDIVEFIEQNNEEDNNG